LAEQQSGLRFDIYERVHLSEGVAGIKELEDVELVPHIQVLPQGEQALLRGNLLLSGTYVDEQDAENRTLEHLIPVEITLPMNRVQRMEDISVEIENFDVDLLSTRSLNITGVLSLNGLEVTSSNTGGEWKETEEEVVFVSEAPDPRLSEPRYPEPNFSGWPNPELSAYDPQAPFAQPGQYPQQSYYPQQPYAQPYPPQQEWSSPSLAYAAANPIVEPETRDGDQDRQSLTLEAGAVPAEQEETSAAANAVSEEEPVQTAGAGEANEPPAAEEKKELKIAFNGKKAPEEEPVLEKPVGLTTLLQNAVASKHETRQGRDKQAEPAQAPAPAVNEKLEWKKLLLSSMQEQNEFRRVRLCIVQKEETLEIIAKRYELNPREIALFNRLGDAELTEGQIVYIPK